MIRKKWIIVAFTICVVLITSCNLNGVQYISCELPNPIDIPQTSNNLAINIYVDGTPSMTGYVATNTKSHYSQVIDWLADLIINEQVSIKYNRLGTSIQEISRDQFREDAKSQDFYNGKGSQYLKFDVIQIQNAIISSQEDNNLSIIVTDLYQKDTDITKVSEAIKNNYLNQKKVKIGYAVGILAIKSEFQGTIFTEYKNIPEFKYYTDGMNLDKFHPFYVIFLGKYADISNYFNNFSEKNKELIKQSKLVIFSPKYIIQEALEVSASKLPNLPKSNNIRRNSSLQKGNIILERKNKEKNYIDLLEISSQDEVTLDYKINLKVFPYSLLFDSNYLRHEVLPKVFMNSNSNTFNSNLESAIEIANSKIDNYGNQFSLVTKIKSINIEPGIYSFIVDIVPTKLQEQDWWEDWNSTEANIKEGSKTYNLAKFLQQLKTITENLMPNELTIKGNNQPILGRLCYAIQKN